MPPRLVRTRLPRAVRTRLPRAINLEVVNLLASAPAVFWGLVDSETSVLKAALVDSKAALDDSKAALADSKAENARELTLVQALAANEYASLQNSLDMSQGLLSVRAVLEQIAFDFTSLAKSSRAGGVRRRRR